MKAKAYQSIFQDALSELYDRDESAQFFFLALAHFQGLKRIDLALDPQIELAHEDRWKALLEALLQQQPIQYLLGETEFCGLPFAVSPAVLIPRPETEELVEWILSAIRHQGATHSRLIDIGTGSGCIAISLAHSLPQAQVQALDVSPQALEVAQANAKTNKVKVDFRQQDILQTDDLGQLFDVIVSNPPYVRMNEKSQIKPNVLEHEPHLALFVEDTDALVFYRKIAMLAQKNLSPNGLLFFEINQYLGEETVALLQSLGFKNIRLKKDIYGNHRMICCTL